MAISFEEAIRHITANCRVLDEIEVPVTRLAGYVLAEDVVSPIEMPPFNKSAMDGYALRADDAKNNDSLECIGLIQAGEIWAKPIGVGQCVKIMTGAAVPADTDAVVMVEDTEQKEAFVKINRSVKNGANICLKGEDIAKGAVVAEKGTLLSVSHAAVLSAVGRRTVKVIRRPTVAIINTGGEIVQPGESLREGAIYNSNGPQLESLLLTGGIASKWLGNIKDDEKYLEKAIKSGLDSDILIISGGVSMGDYDLVPSVLKRLGVKEIFHNVNVKPGKPMFFGTGPNGIVFGMPGNPVSTFLAYELYVKTAICRMTGIKDDMPVLSRGIIKNDIKLGDRRQFLPVKITRTNNGYELEKVKSNGSADILGLSKADGFATFATGNGILPAGSETDFLSWK